jgi:prolyl-tRNA synthetase
MKGVPLRIEIGPKDVEKGSMVLARRDILGKAGKSFIPMDGYVQAVSDMLDAIQANLLVKATKFRDEHIFEVEDYETFKDVVENKGWALGWWYDDAENEAKVKEDTRATLRVFAPSEGEGTCFFSGKKTNKKAYFAKAY